MDSPFAKARDFSKFLPDVAPFNGTAEQALNGNALAHQGDGQNVLFVDSHVGFEKRAFCSVGDDNIYTSWDGNDKIRGKPAQFGSMPAGPDDSLLVNDLAVAGRRK
jgi:prepilin-type processing-associated H-X9-DG protein